MSLFVKICGICSKRDLEEVCALGPDAVGFVFWPRAKRYVRPEQVAGWLNSIPEQIKKVGVFVEPPASTVESIAQTCHLDTIQIHLISNDWKIDRPLFQGLEVWTAPRLDSGFKPSVIEHLLPPPSVVLVDSFDEKTIGGTGIQTDLVRASSLVQMLPQRVLLAGGLTSDNVREAVAAVRPWGVDVSSGVEKEPGVKDPRKVEQFLAAARRL
jgi:phosphoribosylanthranilate isomerase